MRRLIYAAIFCFFATAAQAQSACPYIAYGAVLTAAQWNACFSAKQDALGFVPVNKAGDVMLGKLTMLTSTVTTAGINLPQGSAPTSPVNGDVWTTLSGIFVRINGLTIGPLAGANSTSFAATAPIAISFPSNVVTYALNKDANFSTVGGNLALATGGVAYPSTVTGGAQGAGTINATGLFINGVAVASSATAITALTGDVTATGPGSVAATLATAQPGAHTWALAQTFTSGIILGSTQTVQWTGRSLIFSDADGNIRLSNSAQTGFSLLQFGGTSASFPAIKRSGAGLAVRVADDSADAAITAGAANFSGATVAPIFQSTVATGTAPFTVASTTLVANLYVARAALADTVTTNANLTGDVTSVGNATTLATVNSNVGTFGSATACVTETVNGKGLITAVSAATCAPAVGSVTGLGTGVATALGVNVGSAGAFVTFNGAGGTPSSMTATNLTGTAAGLTAGTVTTNANLTGVITSSGNVTSIASQTGTGTKFVVDTGPTIASLTVTTAFTATGLVTNGDLAGSIAASKLIGTDIATVGTLTAGTASTGFTIQASNVTYTGTIPTANLPNATSGAFGTIKPDNSTITISGGVITAIGGVATSVQPGTTTVTGGTNGNCLGTGGSSVMNQITCASLTATGQVLSGGAVATEFNIGIVSSGTTTIDCGKNPYQWMINGGASNIAAPAVTATSSGCDVQVVNGAGAGNITLINFPTSPTGIGDTFTTANTASGTATFTNSSANIGFTNTLVAGQKVYFTNSGGALPTNFTANTIYYVIATGLSTSNIQVSATPGGSAITAASAGSGTQTAHVPSVFLLVMNQVNGLATPFWKQQQ